MQAGLCDTEYRNNTLPCSHKTKSQLVPNWRIIPTGHCSPKSEPDSKDKNKKGTKVKVDQKADMWAFGVMLVLVFSRHYPFHYDKFDELCENFVPEDLDSLLHPIVEKRMAAYLEARWLNLLRPFVLACLASQPRSRVSSENLYRMMDRMPYMP